MAAAFAEDIQRSELESRDTTVFFAEREGDVVGYVMLRERTPPASLGLEDALEIARLYARKRALGSGVGAALMQRAIAEAAGRGKDAVWLGVWDRNERAIRFYESWGFHRIGDAALPARHRSADRPRDGAAPRPGVLTCGTP